MNSSGVLTGLARISIVMVLGTVCLLLALS